MSAEINTAELPKEETTAMEEGTANDTPTDDAVVDEDAAKAKRSACIKKVIIGLILLGFIIYVIVDSQTNNYVLSGINSFLGWIENNITAGVFAFIGVYFLATIFWVPGSILTLGAGFVFSAALDSLGWGVLLGTGAVWVGASAGAIASFLLGRYLFRDGFVGRLKNRFTIFQAVDNALVDKGLFIMVLLRLSPIIPFNALNYVAGVTGVQFWQYCVACVAMLPGTILYVFLGASAGSLAEIGGMSGEEEEANPNAGRDRTITIVVIVVGVIFGILAVGVTSYYAKKELNKVLEKDQETAEGDANAEANADEEQGKSDEGSM